MLTNIQNCENCPKYRKSIMSCPRGAKGARIAKHKKEIVDRILEQKSTPGYQNGEQTTVNIGLLNVPEVHH